jgi:CubicO group peptidase (beta-lactamase class C family)
MMLALLLSLHYGTPQEANLGNWFVHRMDREIHRGLGTVYPGAVVLVARNGVIVKHEAYGDAVQYSGQQVAMRADTMFDLASLSKLFTSIAVMQLVEQGKIDLDAPVARYLPEFAQNGKQNVHVRHLLAHTSGLPAHVPLWKDQATREARIAEVLAQTPQAPPGARYVYSDLGLITAGLIVEKVSGQSLDAYVGEHITGPLGMKDTMYRPPASLRPRIAATEYQPERGLVWGTVHDENSWSLGGVAGHAGVFSTAADLATLAQAILDGGAPILSPASLREMERNQNPGIPDGARGLGFDLDSTFFMGLLAGPHTIGHTGFTGTSLVIDLENRSFLIFLTNTVHPLRGHKLNPTRRALATDLALAQPGFLLIYVGRRAAIAAGAALLVALVIGFWRRRQVALRAVAPL